MYLSLPTIEENAASPLPISRILPCLLVTFLFALLSIILVPSSVQKFALGGVADIFGDMKQHREGGGSYNLAMNNPTFNFGWVDPKRYDSSEILMPDGTQNVGATMAKSNKADRNIAIDLAANKAYINFGKSEGFFASIASVTTGSKR